MAQACIRPVGSYTELSSRHMFGPCAVGRASRGLQRSVSTLPLTLAAMHVAPFPPPDQTCARYLSSLPFPSSPAAPRASHGSPSHDDAATPSSQTMYRRWTWPLVPDRNEPEPVPGLKDVLSKVGLDRFSCEAEAWCREVGAAFLEECAEECEDLSMALGPYGILKCRELKAALWAHAHGYDNDHRCEDTG